MSNESTRASPLPPYRLSLLGYPDEATAQQHSATIQLIVREAAQHLDLAGLDGITLAFDYPGALRMLDRGYTTKHVLAPSTEAAVGIAMTPAVLRDGALKSHVVLNAGYLPALSELGVDADDSAFAIHTIFHELAHVEITHQYDQCFPGVLLRPVDNFHRFVRLDVVRACWDEYAATRRSALVGQSPAEGYEEVFIGALAATPSRPLASLAALSSHGDFERFVRDVYGAYGSLCKWAAYVLGDADSR